MAAVVIRIPEAAVLGIVGDAVVGAALQQPVALPVLVAVALPLQAEVSSLAEVAAVLPAAADSPHRRQLLQRDHHCFTCATVFQFSHLFKKEFLLLLLDTSSQRLTWANWQLVLGESGSQRKALQT